MSGGAFRAPSWTGWALLLVRLLLVPLLVLFGAAGAAQAHAVVTGTEPADGAVLSEQPSEVVVRFNEPVSLTRAQVLGPDGEDVLAPEAARSGEDGLHLPLPADLATGTYTVSYHVVSLDGHPVAGSLVFSLGEVTGTVPGAMEAGDARAWRWTFVASRVALYLGLFGAAGGVAYTVLVRPASASQDATGRILRASAALGLLAAVMALGLQGGLLLGGPLSLLAEPGTWLAGTRSTFGRTALCAMAGLALIWATSRSGRARGIGALSLAGAGLVLAAFALSGHVVTAGPRWLTTPPLLVHAAMAAFWVGSLVPLHRALTGPAPEADALLERFSRLAVWAVPVLIAAGLVMAWFQVRRPEALVTTDYGRVLLAKLALVAALLGLAALNRLRLTPALVRGETQAARRFGWSITGEVGLVLAILALTATLGTTPPPRALQVTAPANASDPHAHAEHGHGHGQEPSDRVLPLAGQGFEGEVTLEPGQVGRNTARIELRDAQGRPLEVLQVSLRLSNPDRGVAPLERLARQARPGVWQVDDMILGVTGEWQVDVDVLVSDFERQTVPLSLDLE